MNRLMIFKHNINKIWAKAFVIKNKALELKLNDFDYFLFKRHLNIIAYEFNLNKRNRTTYD